MIFTVKCNKCGETFDIGINEANFEWVDTDPDRSMGPEKTHEYNDEFSYLCGNDISVVIDVWEYPMNAYNYHEVKIKGATTEKDIKDDTNLFRLLESVCQQNL